MHHDKIENITSFFVTIVAVKLKFGNNIKNTGNLLRVRTLDRHLKKFIANQFFIDTHINATCP